MARPAVAQIDLAALEHNFNVAQSLATDSQIVAVIKANAYGHGAIEVSRAMESYVPMFGVASIEEALNLREAGIHKPILLMEGCFSGDEVSIASVNNFQLVAHSEQQIQQILEASLAHPIKVWLKIDTGMHRLGVMPEDAEHYFRELESSENVQQEIVLTTHLACADDLENPITFSQLSRFEAVNGKLEAVCSIANSAAVMAWPSARKDWIRPGIMLYGISPFTVVHEHDLKLKPVMTLKSSIISLREIEVGESVGYGHCWQASRRSTIATVAIGYGDGYPRNAKEGTPVMINGEIAPLVGKVSMDMITVDVTDLANLNVADDVILWGPDLCVNEVARCADTIGYELVTRMTGRVPHVYIEKEGPEIPLQS